MIETIPAIQGLRFVLSVFLGNVNEARLGTVFRQRRHPGDQLMISFGIPSFMQNCRCFLDFLHRV